MLKLVSKLIILVNQFTIRDLTLLIMEIPCSLTVDEDLAFKRSAVQISAKALNLDQHFMDRQ